MSLTLLGLMRRANAIEPGQDKAMAAVKTGKAKMLILPADATERAERNAAFATEGRRIKVLKVPYTNEEISHAIGIGGCTMLAITDKGFAGAFEKSLNKNREGEE